MPHVSGYSDEEKDFTKPKSRQIIEAPQESMPLVHVLRSLVHKPSAPSVASGRLRLRLLGLVVPLPELTPGIVLRD